MPAALRLALAFTALTCTSAPAQPACGRAQVPCTVGEARYYAALPENPAGAPLVIYLHGYSASGKGAINNDALTGTFTARDYAFIAPDGQPDPNSPKALDWAVADGNPMPRDDMALLKQVKSDAIARFGLDGTKVLLAGYSRGGSMVWDVACRAPDFARAFAPYSGAFWEPMWTSCAGPVDIFHAHGFADRTVPMEGRRFNYHGLEFEQADLMKSLRILGVAGGCPQVADRVDTQGTEWTKYWTKCASGSMRLEIGPQGHKRPDGWATGVLDWFEALDQG